MQFQKDNAQEVLFVYRHFPLNSIHDKASLASQAADAAGLQGKFWEMKYLLMDQTNWTEWTALSVDDFTKWLSTKAATIPGLDVDQFAKDLTSDAVVKKVADDTASATKIGLGGTPSIYIFLDGQLYFEPTDQVPGDYETLSLILKLSRLTSREFKECPAMSIDTSKTYTATIKTEKGDIVLDLLADKAPVTVNSFIFLAKNGWYDGVTFHRVLADFVAQAGDPSGTGVGGPGYTIKDEIDANLKYDKEGVVGMAHSGANTNGSQFFITLAPQTALDGRYTIFAYVSQGMDVVRSLTQRDPNTAANLPDGDKILSITISEK